MRRTTTLLVVFTICFILGYSQAENKVYIKPNSHSHCPEAPCITLLNYSSHQNSYNFTCLLLLNGVHILDQDISFTGHENISLKAYNRSADVTIDCRFQAALTFQYMLNLTIEGINFFHCGNNSTANYLAGVTFHNVTGSIKNIQIAGSHTGAMHIQNSRINFANITVDNNRHKVFNPLDHLGVIIVTESYISLAGTTIISGNNAIPSGDDVLVCGSGTYNYDNTDSAIFLTFNTTVLVTGTLIVSNNTSPSGTMECYNTTLKMNGTSKFSRNTVCIHGAFCLVDSTAKLFGEAHFVNNYGSMSYYPGVISVAGISLSRSNLSIHGIIRFSGNKANIATVESYITSNITITGKLKDINNQAAYAGTLLRSRSKMTIYGLAIYTNNIHYSGVVRTEESTFSSEGEISFIGNTGFSPCMARNSGYFKFNGTNTFRNNSGILTAIFLSEVIFDGNSIFSENNIKDFSIGGGIGLQGSRLRLSGEYLFERNRIIDVDGGAIYMDTSTVELEGYGKFVGNSAKHGGAIYLQNYPSILRVGLGANIEFNGNSAQRGGSIFVFSSVNSIDCTSEPQTSNVFPCFINIPLNVNVSFQKNTATKGGSIVHIKFVEDIDLRENTIDTSILESLTQLSVNGNSHPLVASDSFQLCFCEDNEPKCDTQTKSFTVSRGETISVSVKAFPLIQIGGVMQVRSYIKSSLDSNLSNKSLDGDIQTLEQGCTDLTYRVFSTASKEQVVICPDESCEEESDARLILPVTFTDCPPGFTLNSTKCDCDQSLLMGSTHECDIDQRTITKTSQNFWIGYVSNTGNLTFAATCPFDYCIPPRVEVHLADPDTQCSNNRRGVLCGACRENTSLVIGSSKCKDCSDRTHFFFMIVAFALLGILLVTFLFVFQLTVGTGTIHGLILYANLVNANSVSFQLKNLKVVNVFIAWLNLDFGIETCFQPGLDQLSKIGWQFAFPLYLWLLVILVIVVCRYSVRASRLFSTSNPVEVLATVILLSYTKLVQNIITIFSTSSQGYVWLYDGNIAFGQGAHAALIASAVFSLLFLFLPYTLVLALAPLLEKSQLFTKIFNRFRLTLFIRAYQAPYRSNARCWIGLCLLLRGIELVIAAGNTGLSLFLSSYVAIVLVSATGMARGVYTKRWLDILEISYILNLGLLASTTYHLKLSSSSSENQLAVGYISTVIAIMTFIIVVIVQSYRRLIKIPRFKRQIGTLKEKVKIGKKTDQQTDLDTLVKPRRISSKTTFQELVVIENEHTLVELREPMLEDSKP